MMWRSQKALPDSVVASSVCPQAAVCPGVTAEMWRGSILLPVHGVTAESEGRFNPVFRQRAPCIGCPGCMWLFMFTAKHVLSPFQKFFPSGRNTRGPYYVWGVSLNVCVCVCVCEDNPLHPPLAPPPPSLPPHPTSRLKPPSAPVWKPTPCFKGLLVLLLTNPSRLVRFQSYFKVIPFGL